MVRLSEFNWVLLQRIMWDQILLSRYGVYILDVIGWPDRIVKEIFERNQAYTAERPRWIVSNEQICNKLNVLLLNGSSPRWKVSISYETLLAALIIPAST